MYKMITLVLETCDFQRLGPHLQDLGIGSAQWDQICWYAQGCICERNCGVEQYDYIVVITYIGVPAKPRLVIGLSHQNTSLELTPNKIKCHCSKSNLGSAELGACPMFCDLLLA